MMKHLIPFAALAAAGLTVAAPASAQRTPVYAGAQDEEARFDAAQQRFEREYDLFQQALERYRAYRNRPVGPPPPPPPRGGYSGYDPADDQFYDPVRDYRAPPPGYQERVLGPDDRVYRGQDGKYYCRRSDGTTGLIVGAAAGGLFGNVIAGGRSKTVGTLLGAIAGGALGSSVDRNQVRCR
jgi:hypothetical protein